MDEKQVVVVSRFSKVCVGTDGMMDGWMVVTLMLCYYLGR